VRDEKYTFCGDADRGQAGTAGELLAPLQWVELETAMRWVRARLLTRANAGRDTCREIDCAWSAWPDDDSGSSLNETGYPLRDRMADRSADTIAAVLLSGPATGRSGALFNAV